MLQWMIVSSQYNSYPNSWTISFFTKVLNALATKNHDSAQSGAIILYGLEGFGIHASNIGTTYVLAIGY